MMKRVKTYLLSIILCGSLMGAFAQVGKQTINYQESSVQFVATNLGVGVDGAIRKFQGEIAFDATQLEQSYFKIKLNTRSIWTGNNMRDEHLQEADFFDSEKYPEITFDSGEIRKEGTGYNVTGTLTMKGVSKTVEIPFTYSGQTFKGNLTLNRTDYGVGTDGFLDTIGETVTIQIGITLN